MQQLHDPAEAAQWLRARVRGALHSDSRKVGPGDAFLAWPGAQGDGRDHVARAMAQGAQACIVEHAAAQAWDFAQLPWARQVASLEQLKARAGPIASNFHGAPSSSLALLAVTGTNGKTSSSWWLAQALSQLRLVAPVPCGLIGTLGVGRVPTDGTAASGDTGSGALQATGLTTPDALELQQWLRRFVDQELRACAIEASSIGLAEHRLDGSRIHTAVFTNLTQDHLDYHGSMAAYGQAKAALFSWPGLRSAVLNIDDAYGAGLAASLDGRSLDLWTTSALGPARLRASAIEHAAQGLSFELHEGAQQHRLRTRLIGGYNVSNLLGVVGAMRSLGVPLAAAVEACSRLAPVPGRMDCVALPGQPLVVVDYAHTPDALDQALQALRPMARRRAGRLWCVFGCGGDRDPVKRPLMGAIASRQADRVVLTSDNPRGEPPDAIVAQILRGIAPDAAVTVELDRALAIARSIAQAHSGDVLLVAGKGHEDYQEIAGIRRPFLDRREVEQALRLRAAATGVLS